MLKSEFDLKDVGLADVILGINIARRVECLILSQAHYVDKNNWKFDKNDTGVARHLR